MRSAILAVALVAAAGVAAIAESGNERAGKALIPASAQELEVTGAIPPRAVQQPSLNVREYGVTPIAFSVSGQRFTCAQIRVMDEVELITDDSYCD